MCETPPHSSGRKNLEKDPPQKKIKKNPTGDMHPGRFASFLWVQSVCLLVLAWRMGSQDLDTWLGSPPFISYEWPLGRGTTRSLGDLQSPWLLTTY